MLFISAGLLLTTEYNKIACVFQYYVPQLDTLTVVSDKAFILFMIYYVLTVFYIIHYIFQLTYC